MSLRFEARRSAVALLALGFLCLAAGADRPKKGSREKGVPLAEAIKSFNEKAKSDRVGKDQPPLTEDEVLAAIGWIDATRPDEVTEKEYRRLVKIAEKRRLPPGSEFEAISSFQPKAGGPVFDAWSVRIVMPRTSPEHEGWTHAFVIRERWIRVGREREEKGRGLF